jgi:hypothetical protein
LSGSLKIDSRTVNLRDDRGRAFSAPLYIFFAALGQDWPQAGDAVRHGADAVSLFPRLSLHHAARAIPALARASDGVPVTVIADPADCTFQLDLTGGARQFSTSCDIAKGALTSAGVSYTTESGPAGALAHPYRRHQR